MLRRLERIGSVTSERFPQSRKLTVNGSSNEQVVLKVAHGIPLEHVVRRERALNSAIWILVKPLHSRNLDPSLFGRGSDSWRTRAALISRFSRSLVRLLSSENWSLVVNSRGLRIWAGLRRGGTLFVLKKHRELIFFLVLALFLPLRADQKSPHGRLLLALQQIAEKPRQRVSRAEHQDVWERLPR